MSNLVDAALYPLTSSQREIWFDQLLHAELPLYNVGGYVKLAGTIDPDLFQQAITLLVQKHDALRLVLTDTVDEDGVPMQQFLPQVPVTIEMQDFSQAQDPEAAALAWMQARFVEPFDLQGKPLFRYGLIQATATQYYFSLQYHHLIVDGFAIALLNRSLAEIYSALLQEKQPQLDSLSYIKFIEQDRTYIKSETFIKNRQYWANQYQVKPEPLLAIKQLTQIKQSHCESLYLSCTLYKQLGELAKNYQVSLFHLLLGVLAVYFARTAQKDAVVIGLPVQNRANAAFKHTVGLFVGVSPALFKVSHEATFVELVQHINKTLKSNYRHQRCPISEINRAADLDLAHERLYDLSVSYEKHDHDTDFYTATGETIPLLNNASQTPLTIFIREFHRNQDVQCDFVFNHAFFTTEEIKAFQARFLLLLEQVLVQAELPIAELSLLTPQEIAQLQHWNNTTADYPKDKTIVNLFEQHVKATPNNTAVVFQEQSLTYAELNQKANQVAHYLKNQFYIKPDTLIGICIERSLEMVIGLLSILKAGGAYVPLDPSYPPKRLAWMLEDSQVPVLLTQTSLKDSLPAHQAHVLCLDEWGIFEQESGADLGLVLSPESLAYVLFTSGSTGRPKGVMIENKSIINMLYAYESLTEYLSPCNSISVSPFSFDVSVWEFFSTLCFGSKLHLVEREKLIDLKELSYYINKEKIQSAYIPPSLLQELHDYLHLESWALKRLLVGVEAIKEDILQAYLNLAQPHTLNIINGYGPTEATICTTFYTFKQIQQTGRNTPIGTPLPNTRIYLLDTKYNPVPIGIAGELCIAGDGLARGYLNRPDLTAEKFIELAIFGKTERVYKTGDLARWLPDGNLEYLGRIDHQIKLRGFRIELGEIEAVLTQQDSVKDAVVILHENEGNKALAAYIVLTNEHAEIQALREALKAQLPDYMVPSYFTVLDKLPLTPNGKIDRKALPEPEQVLSSTDFILPRNETEQQLATIWQTLLKRQTISIHDNFFELGGDSILSLQIVARARQAGLGISPRDVFQHQTIADLAAHVQPLAVITAEQGQLQDSVPLHPIQASFLNAQYAEAWHFNQAVLIKIPNTLNNAALKQALHSLLSHHDALRLRYQFNETNWQQYYQAEIENELPYHQETLVNLNELAQRATYWQASLNLQTGPITRLVRFDCDNESRLLWCIHHLAVDGVSWRILLEDLANAYQQTIAQQPIQLPAKTSSVRAWNQHLQNWLDADRVYWQQLPTLQVAYPIDYPTPRPAQHHTLCLDSNLTQRLLEQAPAAYRTRINDLLLTALVQTLQTWTGQDEHLIDLESHGRNHALFPDLELTRTVGWFTALYSVPLKLPNTTTLGTQLKAIKEQLRQIPHDGIGYGVLRHLQQQDLPQGQVLFNYLGQMDAGNTPDNLFQLAQESIGQSVSDTIQSEHILDINGSVINSQLNLTFSSGYLNSNRLEQISQTYQQHLTALIEHCQHHRGYTPSDFPLAHLTQIQLDQLAQHYTHTIAAIYPLTPMQAGMLFHSLYAPDSDTYITQLQIEMSGQLDVKAFKHAWETLINRHAILRTALITESTPPLQLVLQQAALPWLELDHSENINAARQQAKARCTNFNQAPLMHLTLQRHNETDYTLYWDSHHILTDGWCLPILFEELFQSYQAIQQGKQPQLPPVRPYQDYIRWLVRQDPQAAEDYWTHKLQGFEAPTPLPTSTQTIDKKEIQGTANYSCSPALSQRLSQQARQHRVTLNILVQAAWTLLLSRYSGQQDIVFGATSAGRHAPVVGIERMIGLFINTLPVRVQLAEQNLPQLLQQLHQQQQQDQHYAYTPLAEIQRWSEVPNGIALFDSILVFENYPVDEQALSEATQALQIKNISSIEQTNYPLTLAIHAQQQLHFKLSYQSEQFDAVQMERLLQHLVNLLEGISQADTQTQLQQLPLLTSAEIEQLQQWNNTTTAYPKDKTIVDLFEQQVKATPNNTAVVFQEQSLTYAQLNQKANQVAHYLNNQFQIKPDTLIGICIERSLAMVIGLLGILKAGGAYVPLDPSYPQERLAWMLADSQVQVLLTQMELKDSLPAHQASVLCLDEWAVFEQESNENLGLVLNPDSLAYVLFTSGSTGRPKGVMIAHQALHNFLHDMQLRLQPKPQSYLLAVTTLSFDIAGLELYLPLLTGAGIILTDRTTASDGEQLQALLKHYQVHLMQATPATWKLLLDSGWSQTEPLTILCGGEVLPVNLGHALLQQSSQLWNVYGPTETTIWSSAHNATHYLQQPHLIGQPLINTRIYLIDAQNNPVPIGIAGELCIAGDGLARGYLNRPDLTAEKFIELELFGKTERIYKTGDLARWLPDGNLEYLGRIDHQVKLRGFRIELGEIEAVLTQQKTVKDAVVILHEKEGNKALAAYIVLTNENAEINYLRDTLKAQLPDYMVPSYFTVLDKLPLTPNGKIDRKALPEPDLTTNQTENLALRDETDQLLAALWSEVLRCEVSSRAANFFALGGHSLLATQLISRIRTSFEIEIPLRELFDKPVLSDFADWLTQQQRGTALPAITPQADNQPLVMSYAQQRLWFLAQLEGESATYNMPAALQLTGQLAIEKLQQSLMALVNRHQSLRLSFPSQNGQATVAELAVYNPLTITDLTHLSETEQHAQVQQLAQQHANKPFNLEQGHLLQVELLKLNSESHVLLFNMHHIISDGWSMGILIKEWTAFYTDPTIELKPLPINYTDYAAWQRHWLAGDTLQQQLAYWQNQLAGAPELLELPTDYPRPAVQSYRGSHLQAQLPKSLSQQVQQFSQQHGCTPFMTLLAAFNVLLHRYSGQDDILIGSPIANRTQHQTEDLIGFFVNTLVLRTQLIAQISFSDLLKQIRHTTLAAYAHQDTPFEQVIEAVNPERTMSHAPLFQVMFVLQNTPDTMEFQLPDLTIESFAQDNPTAKFDLTLSISEQNDVLYCSWEYATDLFSQATIERLSNHFAHLLPQLLQAPEQAIYQHNLLTSAEIAQLQQWNNTTTDYPKDKTIVDLFEQQVKATPNNTAVVFQEQSLTYAQLNQKANQVAHYLNNQFQIKPDTLIGICIERSLEMVIGLLGILKAGGAYVPLDPSYPQERLAWMLSDCAAPIVLTQYKLQNRLPITAEKIIFLDDDKLINYPTINLSIITHSQTLAYVGYTSGSTGLPKGICIPQQAVVRLVKNTNYINFSEQDIFLQLAPLAFDASTLEIWGSLLNGCQLVVMPPEQAALSEIAQAIQTHQVSILWLTAGLFHLMVDDYPEALWSVKQLLAGGDVLSVEHIKSIRDYLPDNCLINGYGPTENTTFTTCCNLSEIAIRDNAPIGKPIANTRVHILDTYYQPVPIGITGELYAAGDGLARGYLNRPDLTAEKFIELELFGKTERVYKTGDLARWLPDGNLEYLGRIDHQVKLRGFRIELGEIEAVLTQQETVKDAVVILHEKEGNKALAAYIVLADEKAEINDLREALKAQLPDYMVPSYFTVLDKLPLTPNGKIDRKALPEPEQVLSTADFIMPRTETEQQLAVIWQTLLKRETISIYDNFFELGGDSILSLQIVARARQAGLGISPRDIFQHQTIADLAAQVQPLAAIMAEQGQLQGRVPLHPIQAYFLNAQHAEAWHFNQAVLIKIPNTLDNIALKQALHYLLSHHDALRLRYQLNENHWQQHYEAEIENELPYHQETLVHLNDLEHRATYWQASLNLQTGPITRLVRFDCGTESRLLWCIHHLAVDGVSWRILLEDLATAYQQASNAQTIQLPAKTSSVRAWNQHLQDWTDADRAYWQQLPTSQVAYPIDNPTPCPAQHHTLHLDSELTQRLLDQAPAAYRTRINDLLLTALVQTLHTWTGQHEHLIDLESHGRNHELFPDLDLTRTVGWFTALYSVPLNLPDTTNLGTQLKAIKEQLRQIPHDGIGYGVLRYLQQHDLPQGQVLFNYLGQMDAGNTPDNLFQFAQESSGQSVSDNIQSEHILDINGSIINNQLNLTFSSGYLNTNSLEQLSQSYQQHLSALIAHCQYNSGYTPSDFPLANLTQIHLDQLTQQYQKNIAAIYPLTPMQAGMLFHSLYAPDSDTYITQLQIEISGQLNVQALKQAWEILINRHAVLRTALLTEQTPPLQLVLQHAALPWLELDNSENINATRQQAKARCTDFSQAPLMCLTLQRHNETDYTLYWDSHHVLTDGWCLPILFEELFQSYQAIQQGKHPQLPPVRPYQDYIRWLVRQDPQAAENYWTHKLHGFEAPTPLPTSTQAVDKVDKKEVQGTANYRCSPALSQRLSQQARQHRVTLNILVQAAWTLLLSRYSGQQDIVFGATSAGRHAPVAGIERMIGLFINTLPVRVQLTAQNLAQLLQQLHQQQQQDQHYAYTPLAEIQRWSEVPNGIALFDSILVFENYPVDEQALSEATQALQIKNVSAIEQTNYPLTLAIHAQQQLHFKLSYQSEQFDAVQMERLLQHLANLLKGISQADSHTQLQQLPLLTSTEIEQLQQWNNTTTDYPKDKTIVDLFEQQVKATPNNTAVVFQEQSLTYAQLNQKANQVAHYLNNQFQIKPDTLIGICIERSLEMVIGLLGILKAGGAYVPLDPSYPQERLAWMLADSQVPVLLTQTGLKDSLPAHQASVLCLDEWGVFEGELTENLELVLTPDSLAYVIYTSGSTGKPKGTLISHQALNLYINTVLPQFKIIETDKVLLFASINFDASVEQIWNAWLHGACSVVLKDNLLTAQELISEIEQHQVSIIDLPPAYWQQMLAVNSSDNILSSLRLLTLGGEAFTCKLAKQTQRVFPHLSTINTYGPTETVVTTTCYELPTSFNSTSSSVLIGRPRANTPVYILDAQNTPVPIGIAGELCIAGDGLARGYLNRPNLTAEKFIELEIFGKTERVYKTGDLARWLPDGNLEYLGRIDHQIKLRGFRIELGEIEAVLTQQDSVKDAVVILHEKAGNKALAAYVVLSNENIEINHLREALKAQLPDYMVPTYFTVLEKLPLTPNGKIDRKALPEPDQTQSTNSQATPRNQTELQLIQIWQKVLNIQAIGIHDNFFELGGHSLLAVQLMSHIQQHWQQKLPLASLFNSPTIAQLAQQLQHDNTQHTCLVPMQTQGSQPPLYCLPGAGGHVLYLHALARLLGTDQPMYGLETPGLHGKGKMPDSVEQHAASLLQAIREQQPHGPYRLAGHSAGGRVALALAHQLEVQGEAVQCLIILDTTAPETNAEATTDLSEAEALWATVEIAEDLQNATIDLTETELNAEPDRTQRYQMVMHHLQNVGMFAPNTPIEELQHLVAIYQTMIRNHAHYQPAYQVNAPVILIKAQEIPDEADHPNNEDWGWQAYSTQPLQIIETPGAHISMLTEPHVMTLANRLKQAMATAAKQHTAIEQIATVCLETESC